MGYNQGVYAGLEQSPSLGTLTTTGANETLKVTQPSGMSGALIANKGGSGRIPVAEVWNPVGIFYTITTTITTTAPVLVLRKNGVSAATGGLVTVPLASSGTTVLFAPFTAWTFAAAPAAGDQWSVLVTATQSAAGVINPVILVYFVSRFPGVSDGVSQ